MVHLTVLPAPVHPLMYKHQLLRNTDTLLPHIHIFPDTSEPADDLLLPMGKNPLYEEVKLPVEFFFPFIQTEAVASNP